jgi:hypothetical protein
MITEMKKLTITQRELVRNWARLKMKLHTGEVDKLVIPENGHSYIVTHEKAKPQPGDISEWLKELKRQGPVPKKDQIKLVRLDWDMKYQRLMERLAKQRKRKSK